jgi:hypothetical protein
VPLSEPAVGVRGMSRVEEDGVEGWCGVEDGGDGLGASEAGEIGTAERTRSEVVSTCRGAEVERGRSAGVQECSSAGV